MAVMNLNESEFIKIMADETISAVIEFYADWCKPCHKMMPAIEELSEKYKDVQFYKVNADDEMILAAALQAVTLPTLVFSKGGVVKDVTNGVVTKERIIAGIEKIM